MAIALILLLVLSGCTSLSTSQDDSSYSAENRRVPEDTLRMAIIDQRDDFEGTREVSMLIYHKNRELIDLASAYTRDGKLSQATAIMQMMTKMPFRLEASIYFIQYTSNEISGHLLKIHILSPEKPFDLVNVKALIDNNLIEFQASKQSEEIRTPDGEKFYNYKYYAVISKRTMQDIALSSNVQFKFYGSNGESIIERFDPISLKYARYFINYIK